LTTTGKCLIAGALFGASGVVLGAWGAHGLSAYLADSLSVSLTVRGGHGDTSAWSTGVLYQLIHALALLCVGILYHLNPSRALAAAAWLMIAGVLLFSGSLYGLTLGAPSWLGPVTPLGGVALISAWIAIVVAALRWR
jgi:uncharacterized membrane protein YgdD (TMEM256/DUF423 family)